MHSWNAYFMPADSHTQSK